MLHKPLPLSLPQWSTPTFSFSQSYLYSYSSLSLSRSSEMEGSNPTNPSSVASSSSSSRVVVCRFSECYQRHVVTVEEYSRSPFASSVASKTVAGSFLFRDEALRAYPEARVIVVRANPVDDDDARARRDAIRELLTRHYHAGGRTSPSFNRNPTTMSTTTTMSTRQNLTPGLAMSPSSAEAVLSSFLPLERYNSAEVEERVRFFLQPEAPPDVLRRCRVVISDKDDDDDGDDGDEVDWPLLSSWGYGVGLSIRQVTMAVEAVPQLLCLDYEHGYKTWKYLTVNREGDVQVLSKASRDARAEIPALRREGCDPADAWAFGFLHKKVGWGWDQCRTVACAIPTITCPDLTVPSDLDMMSLTKDRYDPAVLALLRRTLGLGSDARYGGSLTSLFRVHTNLCTYSLRKVRSSLEGLQSGLGLTSRELRQVVLRMPSLLGMDADFGLKKKMDFFRNEVGMSMMEMKEAVLKQPSLLQYNLERSLRPKLSFLEDELGISSQKERIRVILIAPSIMGLALETNLRVTVETYKRICGITPSELGRMVVTSPTLLILNQRRKVEPCLVFLEEALCLSVDGKKEELGRIVRTVPRVIHYSVETNLRPKMELMENAVREEMKEMSMSMSPFSRSYDERLLRSLDDYNDGIDHHPCTPRYLAAAIMRRNPTLLTTNFSILERRIEKIRRRRLEQLEQIDNGSMMVDSSTNTTFSSLCLHHKFSPRRRPNRANPESTPSLIPTVVKMVDQPHQYPYPTENETSSGRVPWPRRTRARSRRIWELAKDGVTVVRTYENVTEAADRRGISASTVYKSCREGVAVAKGSYWFAYAGDDLSTFRSLSSSLPSSLSSSTWEPLRLFEPSSTETARKIRICVHVAGSVHPGDRIHLPRGRRRSGGVAIYFPQLDCSRPESTSSLRTRETTTTTTTNLLLSNDDLLQRVADAGFGSSAHMPRSGTLTLGFGSHRRPSRRRCDLYACHFALRATLQLLKLATLRRERERSPTGIAAPPPDLVEVDVYTSSDYAWKILNGTSGHHHDADTDTDVDAVDDCEEGLKSTLGENIGKEDRLLELSLASSSLSSSSSTFPWNRRNQQSLRLIQDFDGENVGLGDISKFGVVPFNRANEYTTASIDDNMKLDDDDNDDMLSSLMSYYENPDLLQALSQTYGRIVRREFKDAKGKTHCTGREVRVRFLHDGILRVKDRAVTELSTQLKTSADDAAMQIYNDQSQTK